jgi:hypothetical protein
VQRECRLPILVARAIVDDIHLPDDVDHNLDPDHHGLPAIA